MGSLIFLEYVHLNLRDLFQFSYFHLIAGMVGVKPDLVLGETQREVNGQRLYRCLTCEAVSIFNVSDEGLTRGGKLYQLAVDTHGPLRTDRNYSFPLTGEGC